MKKNNYKYSSVSIHCYNKDTGDFVKTITDNLYSNGIKGVLSVAKRRLKTIVPKEFNAEVCIYYPFARSTVLVARCMFKNGKFGNWKKVESFGIIEREEETR